MKLLQHHSVAIVLLALLLTLPAILSSPMTHDSFWIDWVWADQFTSELAKGNFYPRWLPQSHGGLGSPVFYYYPPLAFYVTGLFGLAGLSTYASIIAAFFIGLVASGFAMHAWLKETAKAPLFGALLFMAAPYHILDFYGRGALAEFIAIAFIPLVALGLVRAKRGGPVLLALSYAGLILSHLPLALLVSIFLILPWCLWRGLNASLRVAAPLAAGIALSAIYLIPALALDAYRDSASLWNQPGYDPESWSLFNWSAPGPLPNARLIVAAVLFSLVPPAVMLLFTEYRRWGAYAAAGLILGAGLIPALWTLPLLSSVQFPFRILPLAEFAIACGLANLDWRRVRFWLAAAPALGVSFVLIAKHPATHVEIAVLAKSHPDVPENLPPGNRPYSWPSFWAMELSRSHAESRESGDHTVDRVFYFPAWEVRCKGQAVATAPEPNSKLLTYKGSGCERRLVMTAAERSGALLSIAGALILLGLAVLGKKPGRPRGRRLQPTGGPRPVAQQR